MSAESLIGRLVYALIVPVFGYFADTYTLARTLIIMGATTLAAGGFILAFLRKNRVI